MRIFASTIVLFSSLILFAQKRITITDPEIEFSFELPEKWKYEDDEYYIFVFSPSSIGNEFLQITYGESGDVNLKDHFDFLIDKVLPVNEIDFNFIEKGHLESSPNTVQYGIFDSKLEGMMYRNLICLFQENDQTFQIRAMAMPQNFEKLKKHYKSISLSIRSKKI